MKKTACIITAFLTGLFLLSNPDKASAADVKDTIRIGIFIESIYDLDFANYAYSTNFWMWGLVKGDVNGDGKIDADDSLASLDRLNMVELSNAKDYSYSHQTSGLVKTKTGSYWWAEQFCKATLYEKWNLENYPFDKQRVVLKFESSAYDTSQIIMLNEQDTLTFKKDINLIGWTINRSRIHSRITTYNSDFGYPNGNGTSSFSRVIYAIELLRVSPTAFFIKLCMGVFIAFLVSVIVFGIGPMHIDSRFGLGIGALFAVAANKYVVDSNIPQTATNCLVDKIHELSFVYILLTLIASVISLKLHERAKHPQRKFFDITAGLVIFFSYVAVVTYFLLLTHTHLDLTGVH